MSSASDDATDQLRKRMLAVQQSDGSWWAVPIEFIARDRAKHYASEFDDDIERSLAEDTWPMFDEDDYEIRDWAANNMNWSDVSAHAMKIKDAEPPDFQEAWMNGEKEVIDAPSKARDSK